jgi:2'-5' RNA ligase
VIRCGRGARFSELPGDFDFPLTFTHIALFESTAGNGGPRYTPLREFRLGA